MARSCGLRIGPRHFELVVLDGGSKKHKITAYHMGRFPADEEGGHAEAARALKEAVSEFKIPRENVGIAIDTSVAAFRRVRLPFTDRAKIEQVLKYEVESELPQWNIDDVIVDFMPLTETGDSSELLVSAVPKDDLARIIDLCESGGFEPLEAELETTSIVNASSFAGLCNMDDAQILVHVGEFATSVVVMDAGEVRDMRVIHIGALSHEVALAEKSAKPDAEAEEGAEPEEASTEAEAEPEIDSFELARRIEQTVKRIRRELGVTLSGARTIHPIEAIYICGLELPGLIGSSVLDVPIYLLDCFDEDGGQPADGFGPLIVAYGVALRRLGGGILGGSLRREELRFTGAFERLEFPLAVTGLLLATLLGVVNILFFREGNWLRDVGLLNWVESSNNFMAGYPAKGQAGNLDPVPDSLSRYVKLFENGGVDPNRTPIESLRHIDQVLGSEILDLRRTMGQSGEIIHPQSAFVATTLVLKVLESNPNWRVTLHSLDAQYNRGRGTGSDSVKVTVTFVMHADDTLRATENYESFRKAILDQIWLGPDSVSEPSTTSLQNGRGIQIENFAISVNVAAYEDSMNSL